MGEGARLGFQAKQKFKLTVPTERTWLWSLAAPSLTDLPGLT